MLVKSQSLLVEICMKYLAEGQTRRQAVMMVTTDMPPMAEERYTMELETQNMEAARSAKPTYPMKQKSLPQAKDPKQTGQKAYLTNLSYTLSCYYLFQSSLTKSSVDVCLRKQPMPSELQFQVGEFWIGSYSWSEEDQESAEPYDHVVYIYFRASLLSICYLISQAFFMGRKSLAKFMRISWSYQFYYKLIRISRQSVSSSSMRLFFSLMMSLISKKSGIVCFEVSKNFALKVLDSFRPKILSKSSSIASKKLRTMQQRKKTPRSVAGSETSRVPLQKILMQREMQTIAKMTSRMRCIPRMGVCLDSSIQHMYPVTNRMFIQSIVMLVSIPTNDLLQNNDTPISIIMGEERRKRQRMLRLMLLQKCLLAKKSSYKYFRNKFVYNAWYNPTENTNTKFYQYLHKIAKIGVKMSTSAGNIVKTLSMGFEIFCEKTKL